MCRRAAERAHESKSAHHIDPPRGADQTGVAEHRLAQTPARSPHSATAAHCPNARATLLSIGSSSRPPSLPSHARAHDKFPRGAVGTVLQAVEMRGVDWAAQDLLVRFDRPVVIFDEPQCSYSWGGPAKIHVFIEKQQNKLIKLKQKYTNKKNSFICFC